MVVENLKTVTSVKGSPGVNVGSSSNYDPRIMVGPKWGWFKLVIRMDGGYFFQISSNIPLARKVQSCVQKKNQKHCQDVLLQGMILIGATLDIMSS